MRRWFAVAGLLALCAGCATTKTSDTARTGVEQLLISNAVDQALAKVDFSPLADKEIFVQDKFLDGVDKAYVHGSIRHQVMRAGGRLVDKIEDADIVMEVRSGGIGTDRSESFVGMPQIAMPGPFPIQIPEIQLMNTKTQIATAKIGIVAYDAKSRQSIGEGGMSLARSEDNNWFVFGVGPFNSGNVRNEVAAATGRSGMAFELARYLPIVTQEPENAIAAPVQFSPEADGFPPSDYFPPDNLIFPPGNGIPQTARGPAQPAGPVLWPPR
jgi:hypothetical protein